MHHTTNHPSDDDTLPTPNRRGTRWAGFAAALCFTVTLGAVPAPRAGASSTNEAEGGCPVSSSPWNLTTQTQWVDMTVAALEATFGSMKEAAVALGFKNERALRADIVATFGLINANGDDYICVSATNPGGLPDFYFNVSDNKFNAKHVG